MSKIKFMLNVGQKIPSFQVSDNLGNTHNSEDFLGKKLIVFFYPKASTPGCTLEVCSLRDGYSELKNLGYTLLGVSLDSVKRQNNFAKKYKLPFVLLADVEKQISEGFGVYGKKKFMGKEFFGINRRTFLIDENGVITHRIDKVTTKDHAQQILKLLQD